MNNLAGYFPGGGGGVGGGGGGGGLLMSAVLCELRNQCHDGDHCQYHCWDRPLSGWKPLSE